jgi:hypothetical protein
VCVCVCVCVCVRVCACVRVRACVRVGGCRRIEQHDVLLSVELGAHLSCHEILELRGVVDDVTQEQ